jgi:hypothetical protein
MAAYIARDISSARYILTFIEGVSVRLPPPSFTDTPFSITAERISIGQAVDPIKANLVGSERVRRHPHRRA